MCGLVGIAGDTSGSWKDIFTELLLVDSVRGLHSTGAGFVSRAKEDFMLAKKPGHPFNLFDSKEFEDGMSISKSQKVILGHNRYATIGEKTAVNAHPFMFEDIMGMHNGTLEKWSINHLDNPEKFGTDSEAIFHTIQNTSAKETVSRMYGAWALVWYDKRDRTLNFLRNDRRPLHYCYSQDRCTLLWASEVDMLKYVMERRNKKVFNDEFYTTVKDTHYSFKVPEGINTKFEPPVQEVVEGRKFTYYAPFKDKSVNIFTGATSTAGTKHYAHYDDTITPFKDRMKTSKFRPPYKDINNRVINKHHFTEMVQNGCVFCGDNGIQWGDFIHVFGRYTDKNTAFACEECYNDADLYDITQYAV